MTRKDVVEVLNKVRMPLVVNQSGLARRLRISPMTIGLATTQRRLVTIAKNTFEFDAIVDWLLKEPQYLVNACDEDYARRSVKNVDAKQTEGDGNEG